MNVVLAEADVPYESLDDLDGANARFSSADVALVVGANHVINPPGREDPSSPSMRRRSSMPIRRPMSYS
jgi:NAD(P) transhydrogenase subunit beta